MSFNIYGINHQHNISGPTKPGKISHDAAAGVSDSVHLQSSSKKPLPTYNAMSVKKSTGASENAEVSKVSEIEAVVSERANDPEVRKAIMGALIYLDDTQIRDRPGKLSSHYDSSSGDGCKSGVKVNIPFTKSFTFIPIPGLKAKNEEGEWASYIHAGYEYVGKKNGKFIIGAPDSNLFMTAFVSYPLYLFDEKSLPPEQRVISKMQRMAMGNIDIYKRGEAYSFWKEVPGQTSKSTRTAANNIPTKVLGAIAKMVTKQPWKWITAPFTKAVDATLINWLKVVTDPDENPTGTDAFFNIPNDADDTAVAVAVQKLHSRGYDPDSPDPYYNNPDNFRVDLDALKKLEKYRDLNRGKSSKYDSWKGKDTGAYLTWLKDENLDSFGSPESGVIPSGVNLVDDVVNANAVFSMALNDQKESDGYKSAIKLIANSIDKKHWQEVGLYYPQRMIFPYCASRAFRDGGAKDPIMRNAMKKLLNDVLDDQKEFVEKKPKKAGAFPGGIDTTTDLSTALGVIFLLNVGKDVAEEAGLGKEYDKSLKDGIDYLTKNARPHKIKNEDTFNRKKEEIEKDDRGLKWQEGLFFAGDPQNLSQWYSQAYTTAMVLEAMGKYTMGYDKGGGGILDGRRINIQQYSRDVGKAGDEFQFEVS